MALRSGVNMPSASPHLFAFSHQCEWTEFVSADCRINPDQPLTFSSVCGCGRTPLTALCAFLSKRIFADKIKKAPKFRAFRPCHRARLIESNVFRISFAQSKPIFLRHLSISLDVPKIKGFCSIIAQKPKIFFKLVRNSFNYAA